MKVRFSKHRARTVKSHRFDFSDIELYKYAAVLRNLSGDYTVLRTGGYSTYCCYDDADMIYLRLTLPPNVFECSYEGKAIWW